VLAACGLDLPDQPAPTTTTTAPGATFRPGGDSAGDPYFPHDGNGGYDARHYDLDLTYDPSSNRLSATATMAATATQDLSRFNLDLLGLTVRWVRVGGHRATFTRHGQELVITPPEGVRRGTRFDVAVRYDGVPETLQQPFGTIGFIATDDGAYAIGEPDGAKTWFPVNDHPSDRASYRFAVTVPGGLEVVANGRMTGRRVHGRSVTWTWIAPAPMASYLATVAIGRFELRRSVHRGVAYVDAIDPDLPADSIEHELSGQPEIIDFLASHFGPYPFTDGGAIVDDAGFGFSLEAQTRPIYSESVFADGDSERILVHELAHQWFGNAVGLRSWQHVWLNEGFATYAEWLWQEAHGGTTAQQRFDRYYGTGASDPLWKLEIGDPGPGLLFDRPVYDRGAMTLQALRMVVGDHDFFEIMRRWGTERRDRPVTTDDFVHLAEQVSGRQLDALFHAWLFTIGRPERP
jgi:aminopeptidase N